MKVKNNKVAGITRNKQRAHVSVLSKSIAIALMLGSTSATYAQDKEEDLEVITVTGLRASLITAIDQKRDAEGVTDSVSAEDLGKFPDINLSESLQRIPGITLNRTDTGSGSTINLRGLDGNFTRVEINGMTAPSNNAATGRAFDFEILPSELFTNVTVYKTAQASHSEGGLAGLVEMKTPVPFDYDGFKLSTGGQVVDGSLTEDMGHRMSLLVSNTFDDKWGIAASLVQTQTYAQSNRTGGFNVRPFSATARDETVGTAEERAAFVNNIPHYLWNSSDIQTTSGHLSLQARPNQELTITLNGLFSELEADTFVTRWDAPNESNITSISNTTIENGIITSGTFGPVQQRIGANDTSRDESFSQLSLSADWLISENLTAKPYIGYTKRNNKSTRNLMSFRRADLSTGDFVNGEVSYQHLPNGFTDWSTSGTSFSTNPEEFLINVFYITPRESNDEDLTTKVDFSYLVDNSIISSVDFGLKYSSRELDNKVINPVSVRANNDIDRRTLPSAADTLLTIDNFNINGAPSSVPSSIYTIDMLSAYNVWMPNGRLGAPLSGTHITNRTDSALRSTYDLKEETLNVYVSTDIELAEDMYLHAGLRYLKTDQTSNGTAFVNGESSPASQSNSYSDVLPSLNLRYDITEEVVLRAAYSKSFSRPNLARLAPSESFSGVDEGGGFGSKGNPNLEPFTADNIDLGIEWYFSQEGLVSFNLFKKDIDGLIDTGTVIEDRTFPRQSDAQLVTAPIVFNVPSNGATAKIDGFEVSAQSNLFFLPEGWMQNFGIQANFTKTSSSAAFASEGDIRSAGLPGLSETSYNLALYYDDKRFSFKAAYAWRSDYLHAFAGAWGVPRFQEDYGQLDFSANYEVMENLQIQLQVLNVTEENVEYTSDAVRAPNNFTQLQRSILLGARYSF